MTRRDAHLLWLLAKDFLGAIVLVAMGCFLYWHGLDALAEALQHAQGY